ncbi:iron ABC transporter permease [Vibrio scophthalmi]|uniref:FecCD family ABC transporter permease n=1 Tax=Vibrio scophthalmi TaxID=45658 RepID=UPI002FEF60FD
MRRSAWLSCAGLGVMAMILLVFLLWHLSLGAQPVALTEVWSALVAYDDNQFSHLVVRELRLPRAIVAASVGASLAVAGALMQGVTRNPLADPSLLGMMTGGALAVVYWMSFAPVEGIVWLPLVAAVGSLIAAAVVWTIAARTPSGVTPLSLTLTGSAFSAFTAALLSIHHLIDQKTFETLRGWLVGSLLGSQLETYWWCLPWILFGLVAAILLAPAVTAMSMGDQVATGLGIDIQKRKWQLLLCVVSLTAASVALAGPLGFVGLVIPHVVKLLVGSDYRWVVPYSLLLGGAYLLFVDSLARWLIAPQEVATGLMTILLGAPLFVWLVKTRIR